MSELVDGISRRDLYVALCYAAKARQEAFLESMDTYKAHSKRPDLSVESQREAFVLSALFLSLAKAARVEAEAMRELSEQDFIEASATTDIKEG